MSFSTPVCRTCLGIISEGKNSYNIDVENGLIKNVRNIREMITFCVPELDIYISVNPSICETCLHFLTSIYNFKIRCMRVENAIRSYIATNNVMEGSCVDLSNVVRQQILGTLQQKNWSPDLIQEYIGKVNRCLRLSKKLCVPQEAFNVIAQFNGHQMLGDSTSKNTLNAINMPNTSNNFTESCPDLLDCNIISPEPSRSQEHSSRDKPPKAASTGNCFTKDKQLMPQQQTSSSLSQSTNTNSLINNASGDTFQSTFLTAFNLIRTNSVGREAIFKKQVHNSKRLRSKSRRNVLGPKCKRKDMVVRDNIDLNSVASQNRVTEVLEANFDNSTHVEQEGRTESTRQCTGIFNSNDGVTPKDENLIKSPKKTIVKLPTIDRNSLKRKLSSKDIIEEIQTKRRRLLIKLNSSLPYLHINKELAVEIRNETFLKCSLCNFATLQKTELESHYNTRHKICKLCNYKCFRKPQLDVHISRHHSDNLRNILDQFEENTVNLKCHLCKFIGLSASDLRDHRVMVHIKCDENGMYKCPLEQCNEEDAIAHNISKHIDKHDNHRKRSCPCCNYLAPTICALKIHVSSHCLMDSMSCSLCAYRCNTTFMLKRHMRRTHKNVDTETNLVGMACVPTGDEGSLVTDKDGKIMLDRPSSPTVELTNSNNFTNLKGIYSFDGPSLSELLCAQTLEELSEQEDDCRIIDEPLEEIIPVARRKKAVRNRCNKKSQRAASIEDPEDCVIICENQEILTVDLSDEETCSEEVSNRRKDNRCVDVIEIVDDEYIVADTSATDKNVRVSKESENANNMQNNVQQELESIESTAKVLEELLVEHFSHKTSVRQPNVESTAVVNNSSLEDKGNDCTVIPQSVIEENAKSTTAVASLGSVLAEPPVEDKAIPSTGIPQCVLEENGNERNAASKDLHVAMDTADKEDDLRKDVKETCLRVRNLIDDNLIEQSVKDSSVNDPKHVSDIQDSEDNVIISDSEPEDSEAVREMLDFELPMEASENVLSNECGKEQSTPKTDRFINTIDKEKTFEGNKIEENLNNANLLSEESRIGGDREEISSAGSSSDSELEQNDVLKFQTHQEISNDVISANVNGVEQNVASFIEKPNFQETSPSNLITELEKISAKIQSSPISEANSHITDYSITIESLIVQKKISDADSIVLSAEIIKNNLKSLEKSNNPYIFSENTESSKESDISSASNSNLNITSGKPDLESDNSESIVQSVSGSESESEIIENFSASGNVTNNSDVAALESLATDTDKVIDEATSTGNTGNIEFHTADDANQTEFGGSDSSKSVENVLPHNKNLPPEIIC